MLRENLQNRPNIYQVLKEACSLQGREVPIHDVSGNDNEREAYVDGNNRSMQEMAKLVRKSRQEHLQKRTSQLARYSHHQWRRSQRYQKSLR
jgi:hypothetical protein